MSFKLLERKFFELLKLMPKSNQQKIIRGAVDLQFDYGREFEIKLANTSDEHLQAFALMYDNYVSQGLCDANEAGLRITKFHASPYCHVIICKDRGRVVGTVSVIADSVLGLPSDDVYDLSFLRKKHQRIAEISSFSILKDENHNRGKYFFPIIKFLWKHVLENIGIDCFVLVTHPKIKDYYKALFFSEDISEEVKNYSHVNNAKAYGQFILPVGFKDKYKSVYNHLSKNKNLFKYFYEENEVDKYFSFNKHPYKIAFEKTLMHEDINEFFKKRVDVFKNISNSEKASLAMLHGSLEFQQLIDASYNEHRQRPRVLFFGRGRIRNTREDITLLDVSSGGLCFSSNSQLNVKDKFLIDTILGDDISSTLEIEICWAYANGKYGAKILERNDNEWDKMCDYLEKEQLLRAA